MENIIYINDNLKPVKTGNEKEEYPRFTRKVIVTQEVNCILVWDESCELSKPNDYRPKITREILTHFKKNERDEAIEYAVNFGKDGSL